jgi:hypothetical protein
VIEDKKLYRSYGVLRSQKKFILNKLKETENPGDIIFNDISLQNISSKKKLFKNVELGYRYGKLLVRLIKEFNPSSIFFYGPTFGMNLLYLALANPNVPVFGIGYNSQNDEHWTEMLETIPTSNLHFASEMEIASKIQEFVFINYSFMPQETKRLMELKLKFTGPDDVVIIRGIHKSEAMEDLWKEIIKDRRIRVSLDLYEIGILLFRKKLQKQHFILRF